MIHDALVKPLPGNPMAPCLAESWSATADGLTYEFVLEPAILAGHGPRVAESAIALITNMAGSTPYEELRLKGT